VLEALLHKGRLPISALGNIVLLKNASMTAAVDRLEKRGFVVRKNIELDRRVRVVELTYLGEEFARELYKRHEAQLEELMAGISETDRKRLHDGLKVLGLAAEKVTKPPTEKRYPWR
jgi:MarR family transcriptional regulator, 2-MHQ and catechol-resistance regulon repressor